MNKQELAQTAKNILWLLCYLLMVAITSGIVLWFELNQEHAPSDTGIPSNFLDGIFTLLFTCILLFIALILWMNVIGQNIKKEGFGTTYRIVNRVIQWIPISVVLSFVVYLITCLSKFYD